MKTYWNPWTYSTEKSSEKCWPTRQTQSIIDFGLTLQRKSERKHERKGSYSFRQLWDALRWQEVPIPIHFSRLVEEKCKWKMIIIRDYRERENNKKIGKRCEGMRRSIPSHWFPIPFRFHIKQNHIAYGHFTSSQRFLIVERNNCSSFFCSFRRKLFFYIS